MDANKNNEENVLDENKDDDDNNISNSESTEFIKETSSPVETDNNFEKNETVQNILNSPKPSDPLEGMIFSKTEPASLELPPPTLELPDMTTPTVTFDQKEEIQDPVYKESLVKKIKENLDNYDKLQGQHLSLQYKLAEYFKKKRSDEISNEDFDRNNHNLEERYANVLEMIKNFQLE